MGAVKQGKKIGLEALREPFPSNLIGKLPKPTKRQTDEVKADYRKGFRCNECGGWHHPKVVHLDYVGHAALTDRFLDVDPAWQWDFIAKDESGLPILDKEGLLWIKLTILGVARIGVGDAGGKTGGDAMKERIGDALRNAGMRFGAALDLWHKGDLHENNAVLDDSNDAVKHKSKSKEKVVPAKPKPKALEAIKFQLDTCSTIEQMKEVWGSITPEERVLLNEYKDIVKTKIEASNEKT